MSLAASLLVMTLDAWSIVSMILARIMLPVGAALNSLTSIAANF
jgi:hypothetical protein